MKMKTIGEAAKDIVTVIKSGFTEEELEYLDPDWTNVEEAAVQGQLKARQFYPLDVFEDDLGEEPHWYENVLLMRAGDYVDKNNLDPKDNMIVCGHKVCGDDGEILWVISGTDTYFENPTHFRYI